MFGCSDPSSYMPPSGMIPTPALFRPQPKQAKPPLRGIDGPPSFEMDLDEALSFMEGTSSQPLTSYFDSHSFSPSGGSGISPMHNEKFAVVSSPYSVPEFNETADARVIDEGGDGNNNLNYGNESDKDSGISTTELKTIEIPAQ